MGRNPRGSEATGRSGSPQPGPESTWRFHMAGRPWMHPAVRIVFALWLALAAMPGVPGPSGTGLESWVLGLSMAHARGLVHGRDIIWTYGPMGFLSLPDPASGSMGLVLLFHLSLYLLWAGALVRLALSLRNQAPVWSVFLIGVSAILEPTLAGDHLELAFFTITALALLETDGWRVWEMALLAFLAAVGFMVKVSLGIQFAITFACLLAVTFRSWRPKAYWIAIAASPPFFTFALYWIFTGSPAWFFSYVRHALSITAGYSDSMGLAGPLWQPVAALISLALLFFALPLLAGSFRELTAASAPAAAAAFFIFKNAMVRQDAHAAPFAVRLALCSVFFLVTVKTSRYKRALIGLQVAWLLISYFSISAVWPQTGFIMRQRLLAAQAVTSIRAFIQWPATWKALERASQVTLSKERLPSEFADIIGHNPVDAVPWDVAQVKANGWTWRPRPIFQSYAAYSPQLDGINAGHNESPGAAPFLVVSWMDIDGRHPFFEDPLSWRALLKHYRSDITAGATLLMRRAPTGRFEDPEPLASSVTRWNATVAVPQADVPLVLSAGVRKTLYGAARSALYRLSPVWIDITRQSGRTEQYRAVPANLSSGVLVNPLPRRLLDLNLFGQPGCMPDDPVIALRFRTSGPREFRNDIPLDWFLLRERSTMEKKGPCVVVETSRREFPSWGGVADVTVTTGKGTSGTPALESAADWIAVSPGRGETRVFSVSANTGAGPRRSSISAGGYTTAIVQAGIPGEAPSQTVQLCLFGSRQDDEPVTATTPPALTVVRDRITGFDSLHGQLVMGDWTGSGVIRLGMFLDGKWYLDINNNRKWDGVEGGDALAEFGLPGDTAVVGDWNGDGVTKLGVFRHGEWVLDVNNNRRYDRSDPICHFGLPGDAPVVGKWAPASQADQIGVYRQGTWIVDSNGNRQFQRNDVQFTFGLPGDIPVVSRSRSRIGVYRNGVWILDLKGSRRFDVHAGFITYGSLGDRPLIAEW